MPQRLGPKRLGGKTSRGQNGLVPKRPVTNIYHVYVPIQIAKRHNIDPGILQTPVGNNRTSKKYQHILDTQLDRHDTTNKMTVRPAKTQISIRPV